MKEVSFNSGVKVDEEVIDGKREGDDCDEVICAG